MPNHPKDDQDKIAICSLSHHARWSPNIKHVFSKGVHSPLTMDTLLGLDVSSTCLPISLESDRFSQLRHASDEGHSRREYPAHHSRRYLSVAASSPLAAQVTIIGPSPLGCHQYPLGRIRKRRQLTRKALSNRSHYDLSVQTRKPEDRNRATNRRNRGAIPKIRSSTRMAGSRCRIETT
jgi:hypothetical protein